MMNLPEDTAEMLERAREMVGMNIFYFRRARRLTQIELARRIGISSQHLSLLERGLKPISTDEMFLIARELRIAPSALLDFGENG